MKLFYQGMICFAVLGILCSCDGGALPSNYTTKQKEAYCIGVVTNLLSNISGRESGMNVLANLSIAWVRKYNEIDASGAKPYLIQGVSDIKYYCNNTENRCNRIVNACDYQLNDLKRIASQNMY